MPLWCMWCQRSLHRSEWWTMAKARWRYLSFIYQFHLIRLWMASYAVKMKFKKSPTFNHNACAAHSVSTIHLCVDIHVPSCLKCYTNMCNMIYGKMPCWKKYANMQMTRPAAYLPLYDFTFICGWTVFIYLLDVPRCGGLRIWSSSQWTLNGADTSTEETAT